MIINKNNRPSSDMFRPHGWKPRKSRSSAMSSRIDEDIPGNDSGKAEDDEVVAAQRAEALNNLLSSRNDRETKSTEAKVIHTLQPTNLPPKK